MWAREKRGADGVRPDMIESQRWVEGYQRVAEMALTTPDTRLVHLADREADMVANDALRARFGHAGRLAGTRRT